MKSVAADAAASYANRTHPALTSFTDEVCATVARLFAYVGVLALFGILGVHAWNKLQQDLAAELLVEPGWAVADHSYPAFALSPQDSADKSAKSYSYAILRHPKGGRKDALRWSGPGDKPLAELEIYRPGGEYLAAAEARAELAERMPSGGAELEAAGIIETKFGSVALLRRAGASEGAGSCLGFFKRIDDPALQLSGWSCQGDSLPARRAAIDCMLGRLMPLTLGNEPKLAELFAHAELKRTGCVFGASSANWIGARENPELRGAL
jgi:hypothetical protein